MAIDIHESRNLKQARPCGQDGDLLRNALATPSLQNSIPRISDFVKENRRIMWKCLGDLGFCGGMGLIGAGGGIVHLATEIDVVHGCKNPKADAFGFLSC